MVLSCRFYKEKYPEVEDVVMVNVRSIAEMGAYVHLLEYNNIEGMILLSELSRRRIRSINKLIRVGKTEPVVVIRVDKEKGNHGRPIIRLRNPRLFVILSTNCEFQVTSISASVVCPPRMWRSVQKDMPRLRLLIQF